MIRRVLLLTAALLLLVTACAMSYRAGRPQRCIRGGVYTPWNGELRLLWQEPWMHRDSARIGAWRVTPDAGIIFDANGLPDRPKVDALLPKPDLRQRSGG